VTLVRGCMLLGSYTLIMHGRKGMCWHAGITFNGMIQLLAFCLFEVMVGLFWPSMMKMRAEYVPEEMRATIINFFRIPLNLFVCVILYNVRSACHAHLTSTMPLHLKPHSHAKRVLPPVSKPRMLRVCDLQTCRDVLPYYTA